MMNKTKELALQIGANIRRERLRRDLSQEQLADRATMSAQYLSLLENGVRMGSIHTYISIANVFVIPLCELLCKTKNAACSYECGIPIWVHSCTQHEWHVLGATLHAMRDKI